ncbi:peptidase M20 [Mesorhizobium sp. L103C119B0]|uniref:M20 family metallopeptidase n=1 Tax=Mesorhizobium sp. L103C119B0 TaxID=1287085 RepID=UPI0003D06694|nr:M20 family metallopeptidase [Mesorhizobium sp. L103C119B0]ESZ71879.1 peptidase M20 [Mesorhizobium sp. L103C119B0]
MSGNMKSVWEHVEAHKSRFQELSDRIWNRPELNYQEFFAASEHSLALASEGFAVTEALADIPTAMMGEAGNDGPVIAILGEYDALPGLSQEPGLAIECPLLAGGAGHGCGHNMLGSASLLAAVAVKEWLAQAGLPGRVRYYGCPAEEAGSGKSFLVRAGAFDDVDVAISWHPCDFTGVWIDPSLACIEMDFTFHGRAAHAASAPHLGRSALDAVELMNVGVNYMREHMPSSARVHYALIDGGGIAPNVVQPRAVVRYLVRALTLDEMWSLLERVKKVAEGAALMTETSVDMRQLSGEANLVRNAPLEESMHANLLQLGGPRFDSLDKEFAQEIQQTLAPNDIRSSYGRHGLPVGFEPLYEQVYPLQGSRTESMGSTDVGTVSWVVPTVQCLVACYAVGTPGHSWQLVAQGKTPAAHKGMILAAKAMAGVAFDIFSNPVLLSAAKDALKRFRDGNDFTNPVGPEAVPPLKMAQ